MSLHGTRASALLAWVNSLKLEEALNSLSQLQDCRVFIKIINKIHGTEEGQAVLQQSLAERVAYIRSFLEKCCKHKSSMYNLVSEDKLLAGEELELAKVVMLLLYQASMSDKIPKEWSTVEYDIQAEMAKFLNFMLYNEDCLGENLENFLQKKMSQSSSISGSSTSSEETTPQKQEVHFLKLQKIASSSSLHKFLPGSSSSSPMGDIMQTPQFQMRRLKKQLEAERENRDDLERELAENRKLMDEKDTQILLMKQRVDRLTRLQERQAADQVEPKEMEELREKNESLLMRLHETLKQCQDLKTERGQMDRKINQLLEENGDLSFKLRELASNLLGLQEAMNELSAEHSTALRDWEERATLLESDLFHTRGEKKCLEERLEILQGKISLLEDQLAKLKESSSSPETGEVMGNVLQLEDLKQEVASLQGKRAELQATVARAEEERHLLEATYQADRGSFEEEKLQLTGLLGSLQSSLSELSQAKEKLEQDSRAQEECLTAQVNTLTAEIAKLTGFLRQKDQELLVLHQQAEAERSQKSQLAGDLQQKEQQSRAAIQELSLQVDRLSSSLKESREALAQAEATSQEQRHRAGQEKELAHMQLQEKEVERAALARRLQALEEDRGASAATAQREKAELGQKVQELEARIVALTAQCQQSEAQAGAVPALKGQLREAQQRLADREKLAKENARLQERLLILEESVRNTEGILEDEKRRAGESLEGNLRRIAELEEQLQELSRRHDQARKEMSEEKAKRQVLEGQVEQLGQEARANAEVLASASSGEKGERGKLEEKIQALCLERKQASQQLQAERERAAQAEAELKRLTTEHQEAMAMLQAKSQKMEGAKEKLRAEVASCQEEIEAVRQEAAQSTVRAKEEERKAVLALETLTKELAAERGSRTELEARLQQRQEELAAADSSLSRVRSAVKEREREAEQLSGQVRSLKAKLEEAVQKHKQELAARSEEAKQLAGERERAQVELAAEKAGRAALEVQLQNVTNELRVEVSGLQEEVARGRALAEEKDRELEELRLKNVSRNEELRDLQKTVRKLKGELASVEELKERAAKMEGELQGFLEVARTREAELDNIKSALHAKDLALQSVEEDKRRQDQESASSRERYEERRKECEALRGLVEKLEQQSREQRGTIAKLEKAATASEQRQAAAVEALKREVAQHREKASELEKRLVASQSTQTSAAEKLKRELLEKGKELAQSREALAGAERELASLRAVAQEKCKSEESWKEQMSRCLQDVERKSGVIGSLEKELSLTRRQLLEKEAEGKELRRVAVAESEKSKKLEERLRLLQSEMATAASRAAERCSAMKAEAQDSQKQAEELQGLAEAQRKELSVLAKREDDLRKELQASQDKAFQKEQILLALQKELASTQASLGELAPIKQLYQQLQAEQAAQKGQHQEELEQRHRGAEALRAELAQTKQELAELLPLKERLPEHERRLQQLQTENAGYAERLSALQQLHAQLAEEKRVLGEQSSHGLQRLDVELARAKQQHAQELEAARLDTEKAVAIGKREAEEAQKKLEEMTDKYEEARQKLQVQVEQLEKFQKEQAKQAEELKQKLTQQDKASRVQQQKAKAHEQELQKEIEQQKKKMADLQEQLAQKDQATEHYKAQMEKAKTHYDAKKQQNQELLDKMTRLEQLEKENAALKAEMERQVQELQRTVLQAKESELSCKNLTSRVRSLEAQLEFADRQLREQCKFQVATDTLKIREAFRQNPADISSDSLDLSTSDEAQPLNSTRKTRRSLSESGTAEQPRASRQLPRKVESLESLYFTPIPTRARSKLDSSVSSIGDMSFESGRELLSARRRRTTQVINITMTKKYPELETPNAADASFVSVQSSSSSSRPRASAPSQESVKTRLRSASSSSTRSLASLPSHESLARLSASSPDDATGHAALMSLPGYRPAARRSTRRSQVGEASAGGRSSLYLGTCQDEPDALDEWNRIAELQQRNRVCPPHLKTCYPLESRPSQSLTAITDEEMKTGDPKETLRRASMLPSQIAEGPVTRRSSAWMSKGMATRQQRKRLSDEPQQGPGTPESKKPASCFPRPQTPKQRGEVLKRSSLVHGKKRASQATDKQTERRQSLAFSILNTPKKIGNSLLRRGANRKVTPKNSPRGGNRRSPRATTSPKGKANAKSHKNSKF